MNKIFLTILLACFVTISSFAAGHITKAQKENAIECLAHYTATAVFSGNKYAGLSIQHYTTSEGY